MAALCVDNLSPVPRRQPTHQQQQWLAPLYDSSSRLELSDSQKSPQPHSRPPEPQRLLGPRTALPPSLSLPPPSSPEPPHHGSLGDDHRPLAGHPGDPRLDHDVDILPLDLRFTTGAPIHMRLTTALTHIAPQPRSSPPGPDRAVSNASFNHPVSQFMERPLHPDSPGLGSLYSGRPVMGYVTQQHPGQDRPLVPSDIRPPTRTGGKQNIK